VKKLATNPPEYSIEKLEQLESSIKSKGYSGNMIVVLNDEPMVADGQHRAAIMFNLYGDIEVRVANIVLR
tara:strand:- start:276 stop:485 length:210 start_codon:yes stop_codon:yes gene_type:complete